MICVFDCETIPDAESIREIYGFSGDDKSVSEQAQNEQNEKKGTTFLPVNLHRVVSISAVVADKFGRFERVNTLQGKDECEKIAKFLKFINDKKPRLVSFNGRGFDLPMLMIRAMRYNIACPAYFEDNNKPAGIDKWNNYRARNAMKFHTDLMDQISEYRSVGGLNLNSLCKSLKIPGKYDVAGDDVMGLYYDGRQDKIDEYCESDVLNTYWLMLKYELLKGNLTRDDYINSLSVMGEWLVANKAQMSYTPVFREAIEREIEREQR